MSLLLDALKRAERAKQDKAAEEKGRQGADVLSFGLPHEDKGQAIATELQLEPPSEQGGSAVVAAPPADEGPVSQDDPQGDSMAADKARRPGVSRPTPGAGAWEGGTPRAGSREASPSAYPALSTVPRASATGAGGFRPVGDSRRYRRPSRLAALLVASLFLFALLGGYYGWVIYTTVQRSMTAGPDVFHGPSPSLAFASEGATQPPGQSMPVAETSRLLTSGRDTPRPAGKTREEDSRATPGASEPAKENVKAVAKSTDSPPTATRPQAPSVAERSSQPAGEVLSTPVRPVTPPKRAGAAATQRKTPVTISRRRATDRTYAELRAGYEAYQAGELASAQRSYRTVAAREPQNRDALLGLAAVAMARGHPEEAYRLYGELLKRNPVDRVALAAMLLAQGREEPAQAESRLKLMLEQEPDAPHLAFALGSLYAGQARWSDAERAFFDAYRGDASNGDYAYNLAVSLDHLGKGNAALRYYRLALDIAAKRPVAFDRESTLRRIRLLEAHLTIHGAP
jgi:Flp pilus assembly protein TadD